MPIPDPLAVLCALLDRSITQIAEASADARAFDRATIVRVADVWDNNAYPLFHAAVGEPRRGRGRRALNALLWMSEFRREWMVEQGAIAGFALSDDLPPNPPSVPYRDFAGRIHPMAQPLGSKAIEEMAADYDLGAARVTRLHAERAGSRLDAHISVTLPRRYRDGAPKPAALHLSLRDVTALEAAASDRRGLAVAAAQDGIKIALGESGFVHAAEGRLAIDDITWNLSGAGRRADAEVPRRTTPPKKRPRFEPRLSAIGENAAKSLFDTMIGIRVMRYSEIIDLEKVSERCERYAGAGNIVLEAAQRRTAARREAALRPLIAAGQPPLDIRSHVIPAAAPAEARAELRMVEHTAEKLIRHYAVPPSGEPHGEAPWRITVTRDPEPSAFTVRTGDFEA